MSICVNISLTGSLYKLKAMASFSCRALFSWARDIRGAVFKSLGAFGARMEVVASCTFAGIGWCGTKILTKR